MALSAPLRSSVSFYFTCSFSVPLPQSCATVVLIIMVIVLIRCRSRVLWSHSVSKGRVGSLERELPKGGAGLELACLQ